MKRALQKGVIAWTLLLALIFLVNPAQLPLIVLLIPFILLYAGIAYTLQGILLWVAHLHVVTPHIKMISVSCAVVAVVALSLQSIGQLSLRDVVIAALALLVGRFYLMRVKPSV